MQDTHTYTCSFLCTIRTESKKGKFLSTCNVATASNLVKNEMVSETHEETEIQSTKIDSQEIISRARHLQFAILPFLSSFDGGTYSLPFRSRVSLLMKEPRRLLLGYVEPVPRSR